MFEKCPIPSQINLNTAFCVSRAYASPITRYSRVHCLVTGGISFVRQLENLLMLFTVIEFADSMGPPLVSQWSRAMNLTGTALMFCHALRGRVSCGPKSLTFDWDQVNIDDQAEDVNRRLPKGSCLAALATVESGRVEGALLRHLI
jgi:hypothetical protein